MKRFTAQMSDGSFINIEATRMELKDNLICVYCKAELIAIVDVGAVLQAHISERSGANGRD